MKKQRSFAEQEYEKFRKKTRREQFLEEMNVVVPWQELTKIIEPYYPRVMVRADHPWALNGCCESIFFKTGSICQTQQ